jgi:hypothetical protein
MTGLYWKPNSAATVIHPLRKGTGESPERHRRGKILKPGSKIRSGFFLFKRDEERNDFDRSDDVVSAFELDVFSRSLAKKIVCDSTLNQLLNQLPDGKSGNEK